jgi:hypothetical protein
MPRFSLRQIFLVVFALAIGFSIWRLPKGDWVDIPLAALGCYFVLSLCRHAAATRRMLIEQPALSLPQRWGGRILVVELLGAATALVVALVFRYLAAAEILRVVSKNDDFGYIQTQTLPQDLAALAMLVATGLGSWQNLPAKAAPWRQRLYAAVGMGGMLIGIVAYWADRMLIWFLVYLALSGVEAAWPPRLLPPEMNVSSAVRAHRFALGSFTGLSLVIVNLLLIASLVWWWNKPRVRSMLVISLAAGLLGECWVAHWIGVQGLRQLSPPFQEAVQVPSLAALALVASMTLLAVGAFWWRTLAKQASLDHALVMPERMLFFHEHWLGSILLGVVAIFHLVGTLIGNVIATLNSPMSRATFDWQWFVFNVTNYPTELIWLAATIGGFGQAWFRWQRKTESLGGTLPSINPAQFTAAMLALLIVVVASAPIVAAVSFSYWFVEFDMAF